MRVKLQLVMCNDEGEEETVTDVITLNKNNQRIEHLGLTLGSSTLNRGHEHQRLIRHCHAREGRPRCFGGTQRGSGT
jgi:hypothetical protein